MDTGAIQELENILTRLENCPLNFVRPELEMFCNILESDRNVRIILKDTNAQYGENLQRVAKGLMDSLASPGSIPGDTFNCLNNPSKRALFGYLVCKEILGIPNPITAGNKVTALGDYFSRYMGHLKGASADHIKAFSEVLLVPLVSYVSVSMELEDRLLFWLGKYKQRSEWFPNEDLIERAKDPKGQIEKDLKKDLLRYLFDNGIDFSVESETPEGRDEVDILVKLPDSGYLPIEVKVFVVRSRNGSRISAGLAQAADYARKWNRASAYYFVYNVEDDSQLHIPGVSLGDGVVKSEIRGVQVYSIVANVNITLPSSRAKELKVIEISLPKGSG